MELPVDRKLVSSLNQDALVVALALGEPYHQIKCPTCVKVAEEIKSRAKSCKTDDFSIDLGTFADLYERASSCNNCKLIQEHFQAKIAGYKTLIYRPKICSTCRYEFKRGFDGSYIIAPDGACIYSNELCFFTDTLSLLPSAEWTQNQKHFLYVDPQWIDIERIKRWPKFCDTNHDGVCHTLPEWQVLEPPPHMILIDVQEHRLVTSSQINRYVALSYVWGQLSGILEATVSNFSHLKKLDALISKPWASGVPAIVKDAISLTKLMGERYLWVDRLCIVQDDPLHKADQINYMASIYANSYFTIIAEDGNDANHGLRGLYGFSQPRSYQQSTLRFSPESIAMVEQQTENQNEWHNRGWTFQERMMSKRNIIFTNQRVIWHCDLAFWREDLAREPEGRSIIPFNTGHHLQYRLEPFIWPNLVQYEGLVRQYSTRKLTFQSDILDAFSAPLSVLSRRFQGGFLYGLPQLFFNLSLLWRPISGSRRFISENDDKIKLPSWSWVSWEGQVLWSFSHLAHRCHRPEANIFPHLRIYPLVDWYILNKKTGDLHQINDVHDSLCSMRGNYSATLPQGWYRATCSPTDNEVRLNYYAEDEEIPVFKHDRLPNDSFFYPLPIISNAPQSNKEEWDCYLQFQTSRCFLTIGQLAKESKDFARPDGSGPHLWVLLSDVSGTYVGVLGLSSSNPADVAHDEVCELVAISGGIVSVEKDSLSSDRITFPELEEIELLQNEDKYDFINVFWVERQGEVAYRKALGRVWRQAWDGLKEEGVNIKLG